MNITIYDIAEKAGVSIATVSKVINNTGSMRDSTRKRVKKVIEDLNYHPNITASALMGKGTKTIGLLIPDISNPIFAELAKKIEESAYEAGYSVIICSTDESKEKELKYLDVLQKKHVDGFIVGSDYKDKTKLNEIAKSSTPLIMLTQDDHEIVASKVAIDDYRGGYLATEHLLKLGHRKIFIIAENAHSSSLRIKGYKAALTDWGISLDKNILKRIEASIEGGMETFTEMYHANIDELPTAIFTSNEQIAMGVLLAANNLKLSIPEELSIIGFDDTILGRTAHPALSTVAQPVDLMGREVVNLLIDQIESGQNIVKRIIHEPNLIIRDSTAKVVTDTKEIIL